MKELIGLRNREVKPIIVSGDAHLGGMISAWYKASDGENKRLCYEFIYSGLSHEALGEHRSGAVTVFRKRSEGKIKNDPTFTVGKYDVHYIYEYTQARLNFGTLEFSNSSPTKASLFITADNEQFIHKRELKLHWDQTYNEYTESLKELDENEFSPPDLVMYRILQE